MYKTHANIIKFFSVIFVFATIISWLILRSSGEFVNLDKIVFDQQKSGGLYGSALHEDGFYYKLEVFRARNPKIVAIGSSRVMEFKSEFFSREFANLGGAFRSIPEGEILLNKTENLKGVELVLVGIEFWWFLPRQDDLSSSKDYPDRALIEKSLQKPFKWFLENKVSLSDFFTIILNQKSGWGIQALVKGVGFRADGSYDYAGDLILLPKMDFYDEIMSRTEAGKNGYEHVADLDPKKYERFIRLIDSLEKSGKKVVVFFPPVAHRLSKRLLGNEYRYISNLKQRLRSDIKNYADFLNPELIQSDDCEFIDPQHGGEVTYLRVLRELQKNFIWLQAYVNDDQFKYIEKFKGQKRIWELGKSKLEKPFLAGCS